MRCRTSYGAVQSSPRGYWDVCSSFYVRPLHAQVSSLRCDVAERDGSLSRNHDLLGAMVRGEPKWIQKHFEANCLTYGHGCRRARS